MSISVTEEISRTPAQEAAVKKLNDIFAEFPEAGLYAALNRSCSTEELSDYLRATTTVRISYLKKPAKIDLILKLRKRRA